MYRIFDPTIKRTDYQKIRNLQHLRAIQFHLREIDVESSNIDKNEFVEFSRWIDGLIENLYTNLRFKE
jgi:hypothetical protein